MTYLVFEFDVHFPKCLVITVRLEYTIKARACKMALTRIRNHFPMTSAYKQLAFFLRTFIITVDALCVGGFVFEAIKHFHNPTRTDCIKKVFYVSTWKLIPFINYKTYILCKNRSTIFFTSSLCFWTSNFFWGSLDFWYVNFLVNNT